MVTASIFRHRIWLVNCSHYVSICRSRAEIIVLWARQGQVENILSGSRWVIKMYQRREEIAGSIAAGDIDKEAHRYRREARRGRRLLLNARSTIARRANFNDYNKYRRGS